jgi:hypothetical protein
MSCRACDRQPNLEESKCGLKCHTSMSKTREVEEATREQLVEATEAAWQMSQQAIPCHAFYFKYGIDHNAQEKRARQIRACTGTG